MRIAQVMLGLPQRPDSFRGGTVVTAARVEVRIDFRKHILCDLIAAAARELVHQLRDQLVVVIRSKEQQAFQIGGDQDIH